MIGYEKDVEFLRDVTIDLAPIQELFTKKGKGLKNWAKAAGLDPMEDFKNISLDGVPLGNLYIGEVDFSGSDLTGTGISSESYGYDKAVFKGSIFRDQPSLDPDVIALNKRLRDGPNAPTAERIFDARPAHVFPDVVTYTTLIRRSRTMGGMTAWLSRMEQAGVAPNDVTQSTLEKINRRYSDQSSSSGQSSSEI